MAVNQTKKLRLKNKTKTGWPKPKNIQISSRMHYKPLLCFLAPYTNPTTQAVVFIWERKTLESMFRDITSTSILSIFFIFLWWGAVT